MNTDSRAKKVVGIMRRMATHSDKGFYPETIAVSCGMEAGPGGTIWGEYLTQMVHYMAQVAKKRQQLAESGVDYVITSYDWAIGLYAASYKNPGCMPNEIGVAPPSTVYIVDEEVLALDDGGVVLTCRVHGVCEADQEPGGVRAPMTSVEKLTREVGSLKITISATNVEAAVTAVATGVVEEDKLVQNSIAMLNLPIDK